MFGPRTMSPPPSGATRPTVDAANFPGSPTGGGAPSVRGSVMTPVRAEAAATTDEHR